MKQRLLPWAFGFAPVLLFLLTWTDHSHNWWVKTYALPVVAVELAVVVIAFKEGMRIPLNALTGCLSALLLVAWATAFFASRSNLAILTTALWTVHALFGFAVARLFSASDLVDGVLAGFIALVILLVIFVITAPPDFNWIYHLPGLGNIRRFGYFAAAVIGLGLGRLAGGGWRNAVVLTVAFGLVFWSGSRGAYVSAAVGLLLCLMLFSPLRNPRVWGTFLACAVTGAGAAALIGSPVALQGTARLTDTGDTGRFEVWRAAIDLIGQRPWFGYGEGQMESLAQLPFVIQPHNVVLQILLAWGLVGLLLSLALALWAGHALVRKAKITTIPLCCAALFLAVYSFIDGTLYYVHPVAIFAACVGVTLASGRGPAAQSTRTAVEAG